MLSRRGLLGALICAPAIIRTPGLIMPIKPLKRPTRQFVITSVNFNGQNFHVSGCSMEEGEFLGVDFVSSRPYSLGDTVTFVDYFA